MRKLLTLTLLALVGCASTPRATGNTPHATAPAGTGTIRIATYNIELFSDHFRGFHMEQAATTRKADAETQDLITVMKRMNNENQWEIAQVITDPAFSPDILCIEEGPEQSDLEFFNRRWLNSMYQSVIVFPSNSQRHQTVDVMIKPGFTILERRDQYYKEPDPGHNPRGEGLFARGPGFLLLRAPTGYTFWLGVTHQKSKSGNSLEVTQWRNRESRRTHEILKELRATDHHDVIFVGDMNDSLGDDEFEKDPASGGDSVENLVGPPSDGFVLATRPLAVKGENSFHGYFNTRYRELIDHAILSGEAAPRLRSIRIYRDNPFTLVASDHFPVLLTVDAATKQ